MANNPIPLNAFTVKSNGGKLNVLITPVNIHIPNTNTNLSIQAIWDTGATGSAITSAVAQKLGIQPSGVVNVQTANGTVPQNTYMIDIGLPNNVIIQGIVATEVPALSGGIDALIGMDVIGMGDFSITNHNGITCMSFRCPSAHEIDYAKNPGLGIKKFIKPGQPGSNKTMPKKRKKR